MSTCTLIDLMQALNPWLNDDYILKARFDDIGNFTLMLVDGGQKAYHVDDCTAVQIEEAVALLEKNGVTVLKQFGPRP